MKPNQQTAYRVRSRDRRKPTRPHLWGRFRPELELLEDRRLPALFVVNTLADTVDADADTPAREAIGQANSNAGPTSHPARSQRAIVLTGGQLDFTDSVTIVGPGAEKLTINGNNVSRIFNIDDGDLLMPVDSLA